MNTNLGNRIKNLRNERHLSQEYVAEQIGVSRQSVSKWESGVSRPSTGNLICLAELFDVSLDAFTQETSDNSGNVKKRKDISKTLKIIALDKTWNLYSAFHYLGKPLRNVLT